MGMLLEVVFVVFVVLLENKILIKVEWVWMLVLWCSELD